VLRRAAKSVMRPVRRARRLGRALSPEGKAFWRAKKVSWKAQAARLLKFLREIWPYASIDDCRFQNSKRTSAI
jgi:hypothetical protein